MDAEFGGESGKVDYAGLAQTIKAWARELGFSALGISLPDVADAVPRLLRWLALGRHGDMDYMAAHASLRAAPQELLPRVRSVIAVSLPYWPNAASAREVLDDPYRAYVSRYALGRDYHKTIRQRLRKLAQRIGAHSTARASSAPYSYRVFSDSAPVLETEFACQSGIAWRGKHSLTLTRTGSWHFLGEIYTTLPLPADQPSTDHCGTCRRCLEACPTQAIVAPYEVDARRCISYLTIELPGAIPPALRPLLGNRIYGCDDCQLCCPWNRFTLPGDADFSVRHGLDAPSLSALFCWSEQEFEVRLAGSPIRRIGHQRWLRNIAVALGNSAPSPAAVAALASRQHDASLLVREHVDWALARQAERASPLPKDS